MTDDQAKVVNALRQSNTALTQAELATRTDMDARAVAECCEALIGQRYVVKRGGFYTLVRAKAMSDGLFTGYPSTFEAECKALQKEKQELALQAIIAMTERDEGLAEAKALRARVATLEAALRKIIDTSGVCYFPEDGFSKPQDAPQAVIARAALQQEGG